MQKIQVVAIIPKKVDKEAPTMPKAVRKYVGHIKFPVTPIRTGPTSDAHRRLSLLADDDDQQVYI